jgi:hypothetical protein
VEALAGCGPVRASCDWHHSAPEQAGHRQLDQFALCAESISIRRARGAYVSGQCRAPPRPHPRAGTRLPDAAFLSRRACRNRQKLSAAPRLSHPLLSLLFYAAVVSGAAAFLHRPARGTLCPGVCVLGHLCARRQLLSSLPVSLHGRSYLSVCLGKYNRTATTEQPKSAGGARDFPAVRRAVRSGVWPACCKRRQMVAGVAQSGTARGGE